MNEQQFAILAIKRLKLDSRGVLPLMTFVPTALNNLARQTAHDPQRRAYLMTNPESYTASITNSSWLNYASLTTLMNTPQIMIDNLRLGTIFYKPADKTWTTNRVDTLTSSIVFADHGYSTGWPVQLNTTNALPSPLQTGGVTYYVIAVDADTLQFATTEANAFAGTYVTLTDVGAGTGTMISYNYYPSQWYSSPSQGSTAAYTPFNYTYIWLEGTNLYTNKTSGSFAFNVPFIPTLDNLPEVLESDLLDEIVQIAVTQGFEALTEAEK